MEMTYIHWVVLGLLLMGAEILAPGAFLLWIGLAGVIVGMMSWLMPMTLTTQLFIFAALSPVIAILGRHFFARQQDELEESTLNRRGDLMIGCIITLTGPIVHGKGKTAVGDSVWTVRGTDAPEGAQVKVIRVEGNALIVEKT